MKGMGRNLQWSTDFLRVSTLVYAGHQFGQWAGQLGDGYSLDKFWIKMAKPSIYIYRPYPLFTYGRWSSSFTLCEYLAGHALNALGVASSHVLQALLKVYSVKN